MLFSNSGVPFPQNSYTPQVVGTLSVTSQCLSSMRSCETQHRYVRRRSPLVAGACNLKVCSPSAKVQTQTLFATSATHGPPEIRRSARPELRCRHKSRLRLALPTGHLKSEGLFSQRQDFRYKPCLRLVLPTVE